MDHEDLKKGFVAIYNKMMDLSEQKSLTGMVDELAQLVIMEITILGAKKYEFTFMGGSKYKISV